ncbi:MAG: hypothetical protein NTW30_03415, partial [Candidatus Aenigmarchaeota archaeon]|nr:hypothetical protein [Candidatus Aenigmarchaeota archaeon]
MGKGLVIAFIIWIILLLAIYIYKYGFTMPTLDWFQVMTNLIPSSILFFVCLLFANLRINVEKENLKSRISNIQFGFTKLTDIDIKIELAKNLINSLNQEKDNIIKDKDKAIKDMDDAKQKMITDNKKELKGINDSLIERIDTTIDTKFNDLVDSSKIKEFSQNVQKLDKNIQNIESLKQENRESNNYNKNMIKFLEQETAFIQFMLTTVKYNKKQKEEIENKLKRLNRDLTTLKGEDYKRTLAEQKQVKGQQEEYNEVIEHGELTEQA